MLILAAMVALAVVGALNRVQPVENGPLVVSMGGELQVIDTHDGSARTIPLGGDAARGVSRSPDGRLVAFWTSSGGRSHLYVVGVDGLNRRELASEMELRWTDAIDTWSSDSRFLATQVVLAGLDQIVIVDVASGTAQPITPLGLTAMNPLWSSDDRWIAFTQVAGKVRTLGVIRTDGSELRTISGGVTNVSGPDTWSPDGAWIYFDSDLRVYRANVAEAFSEALTGPDLKAAAPASSPDGTRIAYIVNRSDERGWDLYVAQSDGTGAHRLLEHATHDGWSPDGRYILAEWSPTNQAGGLAVVTPDGSEFRVVVQFDPDCQGGPRCTDGVGWGQPRP
jgi:Tol biopolymer transport system component